MEQLDELLARLPERHRRALEWFRESAGTDQGWPEPLADGTLLASRAKGIYKPGWTRYALGRGPMAEVEALTTAQEQADAVAGAFSPQGILDARERTVASIVRRRGQPEFRRRLLELYERRCAISGCDAVEALEAVHIVPYRGPQTNHPSNGLLLRADLHTLFDLGLITIDPSAMTVIVAPRLLNTTYGSFSGRPVRRPHAQHGQPSTDALRQHREWSGL